MWKPKQQIGVGDVVISPLAKKYVNQVLNSGRLTYGPFIQEFEKKVAKSHRVKYAIFCNSGTSALQVALHILKKVHGWKDGDEVLVPALTFVATVNIVLQNNLKPVFVDIERDYFGINPELITSKITTKTRAIIPVHVGGQSADMKPILQIAKEHNLRIIEDSCETMFAKYHGKPVGSFGDFSCFSTYAAHTLVTGVGGFICTSNVEYAVMAKSLVNHGRDGIYTAIDDDRIKNQKSLFNIVDRRFNFVDVGYSYRATEFEGAVGVAQISDKHKILAGRKRNAMYLSQKLKDLHKYLQLPKTRSGSEHIFMFFPMVIRSKKIKRSDLILFLEKNLIETRYLLPLLNQPVYRKLFGDIEDRFPVAKDINENGFYIGCQPSLTKKELDYVIGKFHEFFAKI